MNTAIIISLRNNVPQQLFYCMLDVRQTQHLRNVSLVGRAMKGFVAETVAGKVNCSKIVTVSELPLFKSFSPMT